MMTSPRLSKPAALGVDVRHGDGGVVVNADVRLAQGGRGRCRSLLHFLAWQLARDQLLAAPQSSRWQADAWPAAPGTFPAIENGNGFLVLFRHVQRRCSAQRRTCPWPGRAAISRRSDLFSPLIRAVQVPQAGRQAGNGDCRTGHSSVRRSKTLQQHRADVLQRLVRSPLAAGRRFSFPQLPASPAGVAHLFRTPSRRCPSAAWISLPQHGLCPATICA